MGDGSEALCRTLLGQMVVFWKGARGAMTGLDEVRVRRAVRARSNFAELQKGAMLEGALRWRRMWNPELLRVRQRPTKVHRGTNQEN